jgi:four helix bundle protein
MQSAKVDITERTFKFGVRIVRLANALPKSPAGYAIANQLVRAGTSTGANIQEAQAAHSKKDFIHCITVSLKEARECYYWLRLILGAELIGEVRLQDILDENEQIIKILVSSLKKAKLSF